MSLPSRGAWIETQELTFDDYTETSLPSRGAWIETPIGAKRCFYLFVAPFAGGVD